MSLISKRTHALLNARDGMFSMQHDLKALNAFKEGVIATGMESLDYPAGNLVLSGLAAKYPEHVKVSDGLEGLTHLTELLEKGVAGIGKLFTTEGELKEELEKEIAHDIQHAQECIANTYDSPEWQAKQHYTERTIELPELLALVSGETPEAIGANVLGNIATLELALKQAVNDTVEYWFPVEAWFKRIEDPETTPEERVSLTKEMHEHLTTTDKPKLEFPTLDVTGGNTSRVLSPLTQTTVIPIGEALRQVFDAVINFKVILSPALACGIEKGRLPQGDLSDEAFEELKRLTETTTVAKGALVLLQKSSKYALKLAETLEAWIVASTK